MSVVTPTPLRISNAVKWIIVVVASMGFLFDIYSVLVAPLIIQPALLELGNLRPGTSEYRNWAGWLFWIPSMTGGLFGLLGGYLTDRFGRRRVLVWSIMIYTFAAVATGYATSLPMLLLFRSLTFVGVCVEFVAAVAWLAELFPEPKQREAILGGTQAFSSLGGTAVAVAFYLANRFGDSWPAIYGAHSAWRYTLISAVIPAIPLAIIRPFLPESPLWERKRLEGTLQRPSVLELFRPQYRRATIVTALLFACAYGAATGTIQQSPQMVSGLPDVVNLPPAARGQAVSSVQFLQETGGLAGRIVVAGLAMVIVSRRKLLRFFLVPGLFIVPYVFFFPAVDSLQMLRIGIFCAGFVTVAQLTFWGNYIPLVYPTHLRGTGEGFAANIGGRMLGTSAAFATAHLAAIMPGATAFTKLAYSAGTVGLFIYALALIATFWMPEPGNKLPE